MRPSGYPITPCSPPHDSHLSLVIVTSPSAPVSSKKHAVRVFHFFICPLPLSLCVSYSSFCFFTNIFSKIPLLPRSVTLQISPLRIYLKILCSSYTQIVIPLSSHYSVIFTFSFFTQVWLLIIFLLMTFKHSLCYKQVTLSKVLKAVLKYRIFCYYQCSLEETEHKCIN